MANARNKSIDSTHLSADQAEERKIIHRDLIAHTLRWSHIAKWMHQNQAYKTARVLDIGCGRDVPLARMLYSNRLLVTEYVGLDYNPSKTFEISMFDNGRFPVNVFGKVDFSSDQVFFDKDVDGNWLLNVQGDNKTDYFRMPNIITMFEVWEHVEPAHVRAMVMRIVDTMTKSRECGLDPVFFMSTPNWNVVDCANNHVSETKYGATGWLLEECGLEIDKTYGTFASIRDYRDKMFVEYPGSKAVYDILAGYYDTNMLANVFAPLYPAESRNCLWRVKLASGKPRQFPELPEQPWTSSDRWQDLSSSDASLYDSTNTGIGRIAK